MNDLMKARPAPSATPVPPDIEAYLRSSKPATPNLDLDLDSPKPPIITQSPTPAAPVQPAAPAAKPPGFPPNAGIAMGLPPNPTATGRPAPQAPATSAPLRSVPMPAGPGGQMPTAGTAVAQKPPSAAPLPPRVTETRAAPTPQGPVTVTPSVPLGVGLELSGEFADGSAPADTPGGSVIQDSAINDIIDQIENGPLSPTGGAPAETQSGYNPEITGFGKIDKPAFAAKKPTAKVAGVSVNIRKPGERK